MKKCKSHLFKLTERFIIIKISLLVLCFIACCSQTVLAKPSIQSNPKSKPRALSYSLFSTLVPIAVGITLLCPGKEIGATNNVAGLTLGSFGLLCGPGIGHLYAENTDRFVSGMFIRGAAGVVAIYSLSKIEIVTWGNDNHGNPLAVLGFFLGAAAFVGSTLDDIRTTGIAVDRYNEQHGFTQIRLQPCYFANNQAIGLSLGVRF